MIRSRRSAIALVSVWVALAGCAPPPTDGRPVVHIAPAAQPLISVPVDRVLPTNDELTKALGVGGFMGQPVRGGADVLLQGVRETEATPVDCVSATYRLEKIVYGAGSVQSVATQSWAGGSFDAAPSTGFFGAVRFASADDAQEFFASAADKWRRCNGQTLVLHQPEHGADGSSRITDVVVEPSVVSAIVMRDSGSTVQRALGVAADCIVDVEVSQSATAANGAVGAVDVANLMLAKIRGS